MLGLRACLNVVLFEFLDDDTKLAQSCTDWLYVQHWYTVVPNPAMRVTLWALKRAGGNCNKHTQNTLLRSFSCCLNKPERDQLESRGSSFAWVPHGLALVCAVKQGLSFLSRSVTRSAAIAAMVLASVAGARRRAM